MKNKPEKPNILIVDDSPINIIVFEKMLKKVNSNLVSVTSGAEALKKTDKNKFALILLDVNMPEMSGFEVAKDLRDNEKTKNIPIIFVTAMTPEKKNELKGYALGAVDFIFKPIDWKILINKVNVFLKLYNNHIFNRKLILNLIKTNMELKTIQSQLIQSEKMSSIGLLAAGVAHEINNPIGFIGSNINSLSRYFHDIKKLLNCFDVVIKYLEPKGSDDNLNKILKKIAETKEQMDLDFIIEDVNTLISESKDGIERVKSIVTNLKDFSHIDQAELKDYDLNSGLESTLKIVHNELKYKAEVIKNYGKIPIIKCFPQQLNQVFMNLLVNAVQSIKEKGYITVNSTKSNFSKIIEMQNNGFSIIPANFEHETPLKRDYIIISVKDTGHGIESEKLSKIFDPFFTTKDVGKGTGLGLSVSFDIIKKHKGFIGVKSEVGKGTTFVVCIPVQGTTEEI